MKCPHCNDSFHPQMKMFDLQRSDPNAVAYQIEYQNCPGCNRVIIVLKQCITGQGWHARTVYPKATARSTSSNADIPSKYLEDYIEACLVLADSPKASAALSRRCLQTILREEAKVKRQDLSKEIDEVLASGKLPSHLAESLDAIRNIGNFAAHPIKSTSSGEIVDVEPGEAEWSLDVLEGLFDFYFVQPAIIKRKRDALNKKLADAGKPVLK